ncbi:unannotated protein [freshwater metagenome]|uniref:Unannotated protein n=1 Tax=freshwater metagenome TaxID=449393 RepID=A0A6J6D601_9ZZZZ
MAELNIHRDARPLFNRVRPHHSGIRGRAAGNQDDARNAREKVCAKFVDFGQHNVAVDNASANGVGDGVRVLGDFFRHEARPSTLFARRRIPLDLKAFRLDNLTGKRRYGDRIRRDRNDLVLSHGCGVTRVFYECCDIRTEKVLSITKTDDEWRVVSRGHNQVGLVGVNSQQGECAFESVDRLSKCRAQVSRRRERVRKQNRGDLGVGLTDELVALGNQLVLDLKEVLDNAVVNERQATIVSQMWMRIHIGRCTVRRPARMTNAGVARGKRVRCQVIDQRLKLAGLLGRDHFARLGEHGNAGRVVSAVFLALESAQEHAERVLATHISDDSAHVLKFTRAVPG